MNNIDIEKYIRDLSPELQEKARACQTVDELLALAEENNLALPDEAAEAVAGGKYKPCQHKNYYRNECGKGIENINGTLVNFVPGFDTCLDCNMRRSVKIYENGTESLGEWYSISD